MSLIDLHIHTTVSDGSLSATEVIALAKERGVSHLAWTDHDTTALAAAHAEEARHAGLAAIPGVELSAYDKTLGCKVHILGYGYTHTTAIETLGAETLKKRHANSLDHIARLNALGFEVPVEGVARLAGGCIYKQHILDYLLQSGQSRSLYGDVYWKIFKNGGPCDIDIDYPDARDAVRAVKEDGGWAVLAHPGQQDNFSLVSALVAVGLDGIESNHPSHGPKDITAAKDLARRYGLFTTGGSDFHGRYERIPSTLGQYPADGCSLIMFE